MKHYSRLTRVEEQRNVRAAVKYLILTILFIVLIIFFGIPLVARFAGFVGDLRGNIPIAVNDNTPPAPPQINTLPETTNKTRLTMEGKSEPGATVTIFVNDEEEEVIASEDGSFSFSLALNKGRNTIYTKAKDKSGNESQLSPTITILFDNEKPTIEIESPSDGSQFFGESQKQLTVKGKTEPRSSVRVNDRLATADTEGLFSISLSLSEGENSLLIVTQDKAGNESEKTITVSYSP